MNEHIMPEHIKILCVLGHDRLNAYSWELCVKGSLCKTDIFLIYGFIMNLLTCVCTS